MVTRYTEGQARSSLEEEALVAYPIPFQDLRNGDATVMDATGGADQFSLYSGGFGSGTMSIRSEAAAANIKTDTLMFAFVLPPEYVNGGDIKLVVEAIETDEAQASTTLSAEVYKSDGRGASWAGLNNVFDVTDIITSYQTCTAVIAPATLAAGDRLIIFVRIIVDDTAGASARAVIGSIELQLDIKG